MQPQRNGKWKAAIAVDVRCQVRLLKENSKNEFQKVNGFFFLLFYSIRQDGPGTMQRRSSAGKHTSHLAGSKAFFLYSAIR